MLITRRHFGAVAATFSAAGMLSRDAASQVDAPPSSSARPATAMPDSRELRAALKFKRDNTRDPAAVFDPQQGMLVGFGDDLFQHDLSSRASQLFAAKQLVVSITEKMEITGGNSNGRTFTGKLTNIQAIEAVDGHAIISTLTVEPAQSHAQSNFKISMEVGVSADAPTQRLETIYDDSRGFFPEGLKVSGDLPPFNPRYYALLAYAGTEVDRTFGAGSFLSPMGADTLGEVCLGVCLAASAAQYICRLTGNPAACLSALTLIAAVATVHERRTRGKPSILTRHPRPATISIFVA